MNLPADIVVVDPSGAPFTDGVDAFLYAADSQATRRQGLPLRRGRRFPRRMLSPEHVIILLAEQSFSSDSWVSLYRFGRCGHFPTDLAERALVHGAMDGLTERLRQLGCITGEAPPHRMEAA